MTRPDPPDPEEVPPGLRNALTSSAVWADPPPDLQADALAALREARTAATPAADEGTVSRRQRGWLLAAAAAAVVAAGLTWTTVAGGPDSTHELTGTELAPSASAEVEITEEPSGFEIVLDVEGLAPAPPGSYYQAWLKDTEDNLVTIGTFHARSSGEDIVLWSGVDPDDYDLLTVTLQRVGDGAESSGEVVLSGPLL